MDFLEFTRSNLRSVHIHEDGIEIYVRTGNGFSHNAQFELATLNADEMGKGALTRFLDRHEPMFMITPECWHIQDRNYAVNKKGDMTPPSFKP